MTTKSKQLVKHNGQIFTPPYLVANMLNVAGYSGEAILQKHVIDNSCGNGAFLVQVVERYCQQAERQGYTATETKAELEQYIHGIELEKEAYAELLTNLNTTAAAHHIEGVQWDMHNTDALGVNRYNGMMHYVVGNPPYVRVHNLDESYHHVKSFTFATGGMTDIYLVFYELGLRMLAPHGRLCYIAPSSWLSSLAGANLRGYIHAQQNLAALIDLEHYQPFAATTYTMITLFEQGYSQPYFDYYTYNEETLAEQYVCRLGLDEITIDNNFYLATPDRLRTLRNIKTTQVPKVVSVKNGFATLADSIFMGEVPDSHITIPVLKASTGKWTKGLFPYRPDGTLIPQEELLSNATLRTYYTAHKAQLQKGNPTNKQWLYYGRTQALKDVAKEKYAINNLLRDETTVKLNHVPAGCGIYSGLYILGDLPETMLRSILVSQEFCNYIKALKCYKSGGYYAFKAKDIEQYINYQLYQNQA